MPVISDVRHPMLIYDTATMSLILWDGSLTTGALTIGTVNQGTGGSSAWLVKGSGTAAAVTSVDDSNTNQTLLSSNTSRRGYKLFNDSTQVAYVKEGTTATTTDYSYQIRPGGFYESVGEGSYTGRIDALWAANASGAMKITELS